MSELNELQVELKNFKPRKEFFIGIDSDGCVFDTMEIKQKECFCPNFIRHFNLQMVSKYARQTWEFVNLYSKTRGINRFLALEKSIELLSQRPEVKEINAPLPDLAPLKEWIKNETKLGNPALQKYAEEVNDKMISTILRWSLDVNQDITRTVFGMAPFPFARKSLDKITRSADAMVVSQTPVEALVREWEENNIRDFVHIIAGQEYGTKTEHLALGAKGKYPDNKILMIGDAPGDFKAAKANNVLFYPINPGYENLSWKRFYDEAIQKFFALEYDGEYQDKLVAEFNDHLPENPNW